MTAPLDELYVAEASSSVQTIRRLLALTLGGPGDHPVNTPHVDYHSSRPPLRRFPMLLRLHLQRRVVAQLDTEIEVHREGDDVLREHLRHRRFRPVPYPHQVDLDDLLRLRRVFLVYQRGILARREPGYSRIIHHDVQPFFRRRLVDRKTDDSLDRRVVGDVEFLKEAFTAVLVDELVRGFAEGPGKLGGDGGYGGKVDADDDASQSGEAEADGPAEAGG